MKKAFMMIVALFVLIAGCSPKAQVITEEMQQKRAEYADKATTYKNGLDAQMTILVPALVYEKAYIDIYGDADLEQIVQSASDYIADSFNVTTEDIFNMYIYCASFRADIKSYTFEDDAAATAIAEQCTESVDIMLDSVGQLQNIMYSGVGIEEYESIVEKYNAASEEFGRILEESGFGNAEE